jgi:REP element-mobilizing transposase RayT
MARTSYKVYETEHPYFMTCSIVDWLPLFSIPAVAEIVLNSLKFHQEKRDFTLFAYIIMENHIHLIAQSKELKKCMRTLKSFTAREIVDNLKVEGHDFYLKKLKELKLVHHRDSEFQIWNEGYHPKQIRSDKMMEQKITYIHQNPVKRGYVEEAAHWRYSSYKNYLGKEGLIPVTVAFMRPQQSSGRRY